MGWVSDVVSGVGRLILSLEPPRQTMCTACGGLGRDESGHQMPCPSCGGSGVADETQ